MAAHYLTGAASQLLTGPIAPALALAGWDRVDITPRTPIALAGFAHRAGLSPANAVVSPLQLRTMALKQGPRTAVIVVADLLWWGDDTTARIRTLVEKYGIRGDQVLLHATHQHSGPQTSDRFTPGLGLPDPAWVDWLCTQTAASICRAIEGATSPVRLAQAETPYLLGVDRRSAREVNPVQPLDQRLRVITLRHDDRLLATLFHHACHPVTHGGNAITAEFTGSAMSHLEASGRTGIALYLQGCCGNINPDRYLDRTFQTGDQAAIDIAGHALADQVMSLSDKDFTPITVDLATGQSMINVPTAPAPDRAELRRLTEAGEPKTAGWAHRLLASPERRTGPTTVLVSRLRLGAELTLVGVSAEVTSPYADKVRAHFDNRVLPLGYTNGMTGYLVTARQLAEGGYESVDAPYWFGMRGPLLPEAESVITDALCTAVDR